MPEPVLLFRTRLLFLTLEATLAHIFVMHSPNMTTSLQKAYWNPGDLDYTGLCGHSSLLETKKLREKLGLSAEEIENEVAEVLRRKRERHHLPHVKAYQKQYHKDYQRRPDVVAKQKESHERWRNQPDVKVHLAEYGKEYRARPEAQAKAQAKVLSEEAKARKSAKSKERWQQLKQKWAEEETNQAT